MKSLKLILGIAILLVTTSVSGQQEPQYTQYTYNMNVVNPAYAGSTGYTSLGLLGRTQWSGIDGSPKTMTFSLHSPVGSAAGIGLSMIHDEIGPVNENNVYADYSYTIRTSSRGGNLAFGIKAGFTFLDVTGLEGLQNSDPLLNEPVNEISPNIGAGIYYYADRFYLGLSVPNILETRHLEKDGGTVSTASEKMHYYLTSGYVFDISNNLKLKPSAMLKGAYGAPTSIDISTNLLISNVFEVGLSYRLNASVSGLAGFQINKNLRIGYAYDFPTSGLANFNFGSHEIMLMFNFGRNLNSTRFF